MKLNYKNPTLEICLIAEDDVIRTSDAIRLGSGEYGRADDLQDIIF